MKKILALTLILSLLLSGCGSSNIDNEPPVQNTQTISERLSVPETYSSEFISESGKSRLTIDNAKFVVPEVSDVDLIEITPRFFEQEEYDNFVERHIEGFSGSVIFDENNDREIATSYKFILKSTDEENPLTSHISYYTDNEGELDFISPYMYVRVPNIIEDMVILKQEKANNCTITLEEAMEIADAEAETIDENFTMNFYGQTRTNEPIDNELSIAVGSGQPQYYMFYFTREIDKIPVTFTSVFPYSNEYTYISEVERIVIVVSDNGIEYSGYFAPQTVGNIVEENVELLSFEEIIDVFENVAMLKLKSVEVYDNFIKNRHTVNEIRFGYMAVKRANSDVYVLTPVWDFFGSTSYVYGEGENIYFDGYDDEERRDLYSNITINAIDGTIIDRNFGY